MPIIANITTPENSFIQFTPVRICWDLSGLPRMENHDGGGGCTDGIFFDEAHNASAYPLDNGQRLTVKGIVDQLILLGYPFYQSDDPDIICLDNPDVYVGQVWVAATVERSTVFPCNFLVIWTTPVIQCSPCQSGDCVSNTVMCIPINRNTDLQFQLFYDVDPYEDGPSEDYFLGLLHDCDDTEPVPIPDLADSEIWSEIEWGEVDDNNRSIGIPQQVYDNDYDLGSMFETGECFRIGVFEKTLMRYAWTFPVPTGGVYGVFLTINGVVTEIANGAVLANTAALVTLINNYFTAESIDDTVTSPVQGVIEIIDANNVYGLLEFLGDEEGDFTPAINFTPALRYCSNCLTYIDNICFTSLVKYRCNEDSFGFDYSESTYYNIVRLPFFINNPQPIETENVFRLSNGNYKTLSAVFEKEYEGHVGYMDEANHFRLAIATKHDAVRLKPQLELDFKIVFRSAPYPIDWLNKPGTNINLAPSKVLKFRERYFQVNSNCDETVGLIDSL